MLQLQEWLVFRLDWEQAAPRTEAVDGLTTSIGDLTEEVTEAFFSGNPPLQRAFRRYLLKGARGVVIHDSGHWMAYGWISQGSCGGPPHLPKRVWRSAGGWIYSCHTRAEFRGRGLYKQVLAELVRRARSTEKCERLAIMIDTSRDNAASRRAILASGFREQGRLRVLVFRAPRLRYPLAAWWREPPDCARGAIST